MRHINIIDSVLEPEGEKATFKFILENISKSLENNDVDLVFAHILVPHIPYGFNKIVNMMELKDLTLILCL